jgi:beta-barrel assembly-enhancing protease
MPVPVGEAEFQRVIAPLRFGWIQDEIKRGQYEESLVLFDRLLARKPADPEVLYARGEVYRLRGDKDDLPRALDDLSRAAGAQKPPAETFRSLGLVQKQLGNAQAAAEAFDRYLALDPHAPDAGLLRSYLSDLKS